MHSRARSPKQRDAEIKAAGTTYTSVPRKHGTHGTERFLAYLDDLANNRLPQWKTGHSCRRLVLSAGSSDRQLAAFLPGWGPGPIPLSPEERERERVATPRQPRVVFRVSQMPRLHLSTTDARNPTFFDQKRTQHGTASLGD